MEYNNTIAEPLRITNSGKYELYDYASSDEIAISGALLLSAPIESDLHTTIKIIDKKTQKEFDRFMIKAFSNPSRPEDDKIKISGKFFNPKKFYLKVEPRNTSDEIHFLLYFSA